MNLTEIFKNKIDRPIEGVIKADDNASLNLEIEEYVLTNEVEKRLESFLSAYNNYEGANGVWVSGFFGSGKSHLLKMLALLLENRAIDGKNTLDIFLPKCGDNQILKADLKKAVSFPSKSILFNIDQKADVISKTQIDALLSVFVKVFDDMCGYYGKQGHIAKFERDLDSRNLLKQFMESYERISDIPWEDGREQALLEAQNIAKAYAEVTGNNFDATLGILDKYRSEYKLSIEDFATQVNNYIQKQQDGFRLNFFVDEVGQYVADNVKLMTNLQTIAESLATKCRGQSWVIVTAQEDMKDVIGEMEKKQGNDFSKIQARFGNKMKLTSQDVAEVIQKRLLLKNDKGISLLEKLHQQQNGNFKTLFDFADGSLNYKNFKDKEHFINAYPFIPYQFDLFQAAIQTLSEHNAFEGKHSSVGERSMLGVFQQVAIKIGAHQIGDLATFDLMFEGVRAALKSQIQRSIILAERQLDDVFEIKLLKILFLVKYIKEFKATNRNLCILMQSSFQENLKDLKLKVEVALSHLEQQTYIQRNGEFYQFLTDEEKDIEQEIKNTDVESVDMYDELSKIIFEYVIKPRKIRYLENGQDFPFTKRLDNRLIGKEYELSIHVITPFYEHADNEGLIRSHTLGKSELTVILPQDERIMHDLMMYKRTEKYIRKNISLTQQESIRRILAEKSNQNRVRYIELEQKISILMGKAKILVSGESFENSSIEAVTRIILGFSELIGRAYPNLRMLRNCKFKEEDISRFLNESGETLFGNDTTALSEAEQEIQSYIQANKLTGIRTTLKNLIEKFQMKPYGWDLIAILCVLSKLCARERIEVRSDSNILENGALEKALLNSHGYSNVVLELQIEFTTSQIRQLKEFYEEFFDAPPSSNEAKVLGKEVSEAFVKKIEKLANFKTHEKNYPFLKNLNSVIKTLNEVKNKPYSYYFTEFSNKSKNLLELKDSYLDPIERFMSGTSRTIFDEASHFVIEHDANFSYLPTEQTEKIKSILEDETCYKGNKIQELKSVLTDIKTSIHEQLKIVQEREQVKINSLLHRIIEMSDFQSLDETKQNQIKERFKNTEAHLLRQKLFAVISDIVRRFEDHEYPKILDQISTWNKPIEPIKPINKSDNKEDNVSEVKEITVEYVPSRNLHVKFKKAWIEDKKDLDEYLNALGDAIESEIKLGKRVRI